MKTLVLSFVVLVLTATLCSAQPEVYTIVGSAYGDIYFESGSAKLDDAARDKLDEVYALAKQTPGAVVLLAGYDDQRSSEGDSIKMGMMRANAVAQYLVDKGIPSSDVMTISFGNTRVEVPGEGEEVWSKNRRVRYRVVPPEDPAKNEGKPSGVCQKCKT